MRKIKIIKAKAAVLPMADIDTDMIYPKQFLKTMTRNGLGKYAFYDMRYREDGSDNPEFVLNDPAHKDSGILITGENFGGGSSREHAVWSLLDLGIQCIIAPSFADIFYNNSFKNGLLPITLPQNQIDTLIKEAQDNPETMIEIDLEKQTVTRGNIFTFSFEIDPFRKDCLLTGQDDIAVSLKNDLFIKKYEDKINSEKPWMRGTRISI